MPPPALSPEGRLLEVLKLLSPVDIQNRLLSLTDREFGTALLFLTDAERSRLLSYTSGSKQRRVVEEYHLQDRRQLTYKQYEQIMDQVLRKISGGRRDQNIRSYIRPRKPK
jgi:Mg/Co/Ni transporter MgtE